MRKILHRIIMVAAAMAAPFIAQGQDVSFSQTYESPLYLSPSFTGLTNGSRISLNYRNQWPGIGSVYRNYALGIDHYFDRFKSGVGLLWLRDDQGKGLLVQDEITLLYSYEFAITDELFIRPGLSFKYGQRKIDTGKMTTFQDISADGSIGVGGSGIDLERTSTNWIDAGVSAMLYSEDFWVGVAFDHLTQPNTSFTDVKNEIGIKSTFYCGYKLTYEDSYRGSEPKTITFAINYKNQYSFNQLEVGGFWYYSPIELGIKYRGLFFNASSEIKNTDAIIPSVGVNINALRIGYSFDMTISDLSAFGDGAHEVSLVYRIIPSKVKRNYKMKPVPCTEPIMGYSYSGKQKSYRSSRKFFKR